MSIGRRIEARDFSKRLNKPLQNVLDRALSAEISLDMDIRFMETTRSAICDIAWFLDDSLVEGSHAEPDIVAIVAVDTHEYMQEVWKMAASGKFGCMDNPIYERLSQRRDQLYAALGADFSLKLNVQISFEVRDA